MTILRTRFLIKTEEVQIVRRRHKSVRAFCENCGREVRMLCPSEAADLVCEETDKIYSLMDTAQVHFRYFDSRLPFICLSSLSSL